jgi:16S rRNA processing protein RimM
MIRKDKCLLLGTLIKPNGIKGYLLFVFKNQKTFNFIEKESVLLEIDGILVPFFIESFHIKSEDSVILKFEGVNSETEAREFTGASVYIPEEKVKQNTKAEDLFPQFKGYTVNDEKKGFIGIADGIEDIVKNPLLQVRGKQKDYLIPLHKDMIVEINDRKKEIRIVAPDGLLDL